MSSKAWADLHGEDYPVKITHETPKRQPTKEDLQFCFDELLGELGWGDEIEETGIDPLKWAREEIKRLQRHSKSLELRDAANGKCKKCGTLHAEPIIYCYVCGSFQ